MLADLATIKARLELDPFDTTYDLLVLRAIVAVRYPELLTILPA